MLHPAERQRALELLAADPLRCIENEPSVELARRIGLRQFLRREHLLLSRAPGGAPRRSRAQR